MAGGDPRERTALIVTVLDEAGTIDALLESIAAQTCPPDEVVDRRRRLARRHLARARALDRRACRCA